MMRVFERSAGLVSSLAVAFAVATAGAAPLDAEQADRLRIQQHLAQVEQQLRAAPVETLPSAARQARARLLDELRRYWQAGVFPRNSQHVGERRPYFIDDDGRACAVAALVIKSGHEALAQRIDRTFHNEYVPNMSDAKLLAWASTHGFSGAELALIQPSYCNCDGFNGAFPGDEAAGGAGGAPNGADYYQPVCANNGLTYWNECIATLCGGVFIVSAGQCEQEQPPCELCGTGDKPVVVSECTQDAPEGICNGIDSQPDVVPVNDVVAAHWRELQGQDCQNPTYELERQEWQPSWPVQPKWQCEAASSGAGAGGAASAGGAGGDNGANAGAGAASAGADADADADAQGGGAGAPPSNPDEHEPAGVEPAGGCDCRSGRAPGQPWLGAALLIGWGALFGLRRRRRTTA
jgi:MYXO-CTERM domain-containing protein